MFQPFQPIVLAAFELPGKAALLAHATPDVRQEYIRAAQDALTGLEEAIERLLTVDGLPPGTACYPGGQRGWEFDVNRQLKKVVEAARELIQAAMKSPPPPTRRVPITEPWTATEIEAYDRQLKECNQSGSECARLASLLREANEKLSNLQCSVARPGHIVPVSNHPARNTERQVEVSVPPPPPSPLNFPPGRPADAITEPTTLPVGSTPPASPDEHSKPDGPFEPFGFRWGAVAGEFPKDQRRFYGLLRAMWSAYRTLTPVTVKDVRKRLEDAGGAALEEKTMQNYARGLSTFLAGKFKFPAKLEVEKGYARWVDLPEAPASQ